MEIKVKTWIEDENKNLIFGSGKTKILEYIALSGSISKAAKMLGMSYKKAWNHIKILENHIEDELVISKKGRAVDSGTQLTPKAKELINLYKILDKDVRAYTKKRYEELFDKDIIKVSNVQT